MGKFISLSGDYILFYIITAMWIGEFMVFPSKHVSDDYSEDKSFRLILLGVVSSVLLTIVLTYMDVFVIGGAWAGPIRYLGLSFYIIGILLRYSGSIYLGKYFTRGVSVSKDQELISRGPYRILKHPLYLGLFMLSVAVPMFFGNYIALIYSITIMGYSINKRMILEEKNMEEVIGDRYRVWKLSRYRFIPFIY